MQTISDSSLLIQAIPHTSILRKKAKNKISVSLPRDGTNEGYKDWSEILRYMIRFSLDLIMRILNSLEPQFELAVVGKLVVVDKSELGSFVNVTCLVEFKKVERANHSDHLEGQFSFSLNYQIVTFLLQSFSLYDYGEQSSKNQNQEKQKVECGVFGRFNAIIFVTIVRLLIRF
ncbi:Hypothetical_protein [Hexamita inflata]|uniref:Hypothetical_protein n=1 Tax=Hexamita inflata TaxID=28002 RepID=A0AA86R8Z3_9EUKA|nr:Hypothetical protein HINF_LOCUS57221 [Hexamita inflata]